ncbi:MAG: hypothetical protein ACHQPI_10920 [Thermoanaerobaculia bacterium]
MNRLKCPVPMVIPRTLVGTALAALFAASLGAAQSTILPRDAAVREYELGREALKKKDFRSAVDRMNAALATGHTRADERFGTSRYQLEWYDPYYWLGVAHMELGEEEEARRNFRLSREAGVIERRPEYADLLSRMRLLDEREAARRAPTPGPTATPTPAVPAASRRRETQSQTHRPPEAERSVHPSPASLTPLIEAIAKGRFRDAESELEKARAAAPDAAEPELLAAVLFGSRYVLEGSADPSLLAKAKKSLATFRRRGGSPRSEEAWLSPALRGLLSR